MLVYERLFIIKVIIPPTPLYFNHDMIEVSQLHILNPVRAIFLLRNDGMKHLVLELGTDQMGGWGPLHQNK
jgi:hypothetical protein